VSDRLEELETKVAELSAGLREVRERLATLERGGTRAAARRAAEPGQQGQAATPPPATVPSAASTVTFVGRTLLVLAGAFVLRALTDNQTLAPRLGIALGLVYAGTWIGLADHAGRRGAKWSAGFHGASAAMIGFPLLFEATFRFRLLSPSTAAVLLAGLTAVALAVAARRNLQGLAWLVSLAGTATAVTLALNPLGGRALLPTLYVVLLGVATLWLGYLLDWFALRWPVAIAADLLVGVMALRAMSPQTAGGPGIAEGPGIAAIAQAALLLLYLGSIAARTSFLGRKVIAFEVVQTAIAIAVGLGGAGFIASRSGGASLAFGIVSIVAGAAAYFVAFELVERRQKGPANFWFYTTAALVLLLAGSTLVLPERALGLTWAVLGVVFADLARRGGRKTLAVHAAAYGAAAVAASGALGHAFEAAFASPAEAWTAAALPEACVVAAAGATAWLCAGGPARRVWFERVPQVVLLAVLACGASGLAVGWLVPPLAGAPPGANAGTVATIRTAVWVAGALWLGWIGRREAWVEARWLTYPALAAVGLKILVEDLQRSRPATLFLAFALYGAALIIVARGRRSREGPSTAV
jgi:hypothetical protein